MRLVVCTLRSVAPARAGITIPRYSPSSPPLLTVPFRRSYKIVIRASARNAAARVCDPDLLLKRAINPGAHPLAMDIIRIILSIILPPLGVFLQVGFRMPFLSTFC